jgi:tetratricopeptide (TPR) repeat protein
MLSRKKGGLVQMKISKVLSRMCIAMLAAFVSMILFSPVPAYPAQDKDVKSEMKKQIDDLKKQIAKLEKDLAAAKKSDPKKAKQIETELDMTKQALAVSESVMNSFGDIKIPEGDRTLGSKGSSKGVPVRDEERISRVPKKVLTKSEIAVFVKNTSAAVEKTIPQADAKLASDFYNGLAAKNASPVLVGNAANGLWALGEHTAALALIGRACTADPSNPDNLNNYAAFLTMGGAEQLALPILANLNQSFPDNSTVLNNIGQAWYGLGDLKEAEKNLDAAIRVFGFHTQANFTKSLIQEAAGNTQGAIASMLTSIKFAYSEEKEKRLKKLGYKMKPDDIEWNFNKPIDPLGLHKFLLPKYPMSVGESAQAAVEWDSFRKQASREIETLEAKQKQLETLAQEEVKKFYAKMMQQSKVKNNFSRFSPLYKKATILMNAAFENMFKDPSTDELMTALPGIENRRTEMNAQVQKISDKYVDEYGEGKSNPEEQECAEKDQVRSAFMAFANGTLEKINKDRIERARKRINETVYYAQYASMSDSGFELAKVQQKIQFLRMLKDVRVEIQVQCSKGQKASNKSGKLSDFDDIHCDHIVSLDMPFIGDIRVECSKMTTNFNAGPFKVHLEENLNTNEILRGTAEVGFSKGLEGSKGPFKAEIKGEVGAFVEFDEGGVTDLGLVGSVAAGAGTDFYDSEVEMNDGTKHTIPTPKEPSIEAGVEARWGWNSGASIGGKGILDGIVDIKI